MQVVRAQPSLLPEARMPRLVCRVQIGLVSLLFSTATNPSAPASRIPNITAPAYYSRLTSSLALVASCSSLDTQYAGTALRFPAMTMTSTVGDDDPFRDPSLASTAPPHPPRSMEDTGEHTTVPDTLAVGRNASLTLGTDSLVVLGTRLIPAPKEASAHT